MKRILLASLVLLAGFASQAHAADTVYYYYNDAQGSPVAVTDAHGAVVERTQYAPYGQVLNRPEHDGPGYTKHEEDAATGLTNMQQRYDDKVIGRMLSMDPMDVDTTTGGNFNRYAYAADNPYRFIDPDGRQTTLDCGANGCFPAAKGGTGTMMGVVADANMAVMANQDGGTPLKQDEQKSNQKTPSNTSASSSVIPNATLGTNETITDAAVTGLRAIGSRGEKYEYDGLVFGSPGKYYPTDPVTSYKMEGFITRIGPGEHPVGMFHSHGPGIFAYPNYFSRDDVHAAEKLGIPSYIGDYTTHSIRMYDPRTMGPISQRNFGGGFSLMGMSPGVLICSGCFPP